MTVKRETGIGREEMHGELEVERERVIEDTYDSLTKSSSRSLDLVEGSEGGGIEGMRGKGGS